MKLKCDEPFSNVAFNFNLRPYTVARFTNAAMVGSFRRWMEFVEESTQQQNALEKAVACFINAAMLGSFKRWVEFAEAGLAL